MQHPMRYRTPSYLLLVALVLGGCGNEPGGFFNPLAEIAKVDQPNVAGVDETQEQLAKDAARAGDYSRAAQFYQQLISSKKATPEQLLRYKMGMADATRRLGEHAAALAMYEELLREQPANIDIAEGRALSLMATGKSSDAGRAFSQVLEKDPKRWRTLNGLGILFVSKNMIPEALAYYNEALNHSPNNIAVLNNMGLSYAVDLDFARSIEALRQASRISTNPAQRKQIDLNLALVYGVSGDLDAARALASNYLEGVALDNNLGLYAHLAKDDALAKTYLNRALNQSDSYYERAWENLDVVNNASEADDVKPPVKPTSATTPRASATSKKPAKKK